MSKPKVWKGKMWAMTYATGKDEGEMTNILRSGPWRLAPGDYTRKDCKELVGADEEQIAGQVEVSVRPLEIRPVRCAKGKP